MTTMMTVLLVCCRCVRGVVVVVAVGIGEKIYLQVCGKECRIQYDVVAVVDGDENGGDVGR